MVRDLIGFAAVLMCAAELRAQDGPAMTPAAYHATAGAPLALNLKSSISGAAIAWDDARISWTLLRIAGIQENSDLAPRSDEKGAAGSVKINTEGAAVIGVDFKPRVVMLDAAALRKFAKDHADAELPEAAKGDIKVRLVESAKTVVRTAGADKERSGNVTEKTGQLVEIRPMFDPSAIAIGSDIPVTTYAGGGRAKNARVIATHIASGEKQEIRTNASAIGLFKLNKPGEWRVEFHQLKEVKGAEDGAQWVVSSATLTFETAAKPAKKEGDK